MPPLNLLLPAILCFTFVSISTQETQPPSIPLSLTIASLSPHRRPSFASAFSPSNAREESSPSNHKSPLYYSVAPIVSLRIGTPPQVQQMVLDTGSQLSWIQCFNDDRKTKSPSRNTAPFRPSLSSSFSVLSCRHPACRPSDPDFSLPTNCDQNRACHYSYFYADGTLAEGSLVGEKFTLSPSRITAPLVLGCANGSAETKGILGMNLGRLSFPSQANITTFSYCVPSSRAIGSFYLGRNPNSRRFRYTNLLNFPENRRSPNFDPFAYTVGLQGIRFGTRKINISRTFFRPDATGSGQTIIDSGTEFTFLVEEAYSKVREEIVRLVGDEMKKGYVYGGALDMCFDGSRVVEIGRLVGEMALELENRVEIVVAKERILSEVERGVWCVGIGRSDALGVPSNIIGNVHQRDLWVEFDRTNRRVGFGRANCSFSA